MNTSSIHSITKSLPDIINLIPIKPCQSSSLDPLCINDLRSVIFRTYSQLGFPYAHFSVTDRSNLGKNFVISNFPTTLDSYYFSHLLFDLDPPVKFTTVSDKRDLNYGTWEQYFSHPTQNPVSDNDDIALVYKLFADHGLHSGVAMEVANTHSITRAHLGCPLTAEDLNSKLDATFFSVLRYTITLFTDISLTIKSCNRCQPNTLLHEAKPLSKSIVKVLRVYINNQDASQSEIANIYGRSSSTVQEHLRAARIALNRPRLPAYQLALYAQKLGLI